MDAFKWVLVVLEYLAAQSALRPADSLVSQTTTLQLKRQLPPPDLADSNPLWTSNVDWTRVRPPCSR